MALIFSVKMAEPSAFDLDSLELQTMIGFGGQIKKKITVSSMLCMFAGLFRSIAPLGF